MDKDIRKAIYEKYSGHCAYCGKTIAFRDMQVDHITPRYATSYFGGHKATKEQVEQEDNFNPSCRACNFRKGTMDLEQFRKEIFLQAERLIRTNFQCKMSLDYGLLTFHPKPVVFYFEKVAESN